MSNNFCVNKSGKSVPVYSDTKKTKQIGILSIIGRPSVTIKIGEAMAHSAISYFRIRQEML